MAFVLVYQFNDDLKFNYIINQFNLYSVTFIEQLILDNRTSLLAFLQQ